MSHTAHMQESGKGNGKYEHHQIPEKPIERFLPLLKGYRKYSRGYLTRCPAHDDRVPSLMIWEDSADFHVGLKCHAGCTRHKICEVLGITESSLYADDNQKQQGSRTNVLTTIDLVIDKLIHPHFLEYLGVKDDKDGVIIPYYNQDGTPYARYRVRTSLTAKKGSTWNTDTEVPLIPYGLNRLSDAVLAGYLVIVEGESDCWTLWQHGIPALGVPGAQNHQVLTSQMLADIPKVYIVQEDDQGGEKFATNVTKHLKKCGYQGKLYKILMSEVGVNDPNDLQKRDFSGFKTAFETLRDRAIPLFPIGKKPKVARMPDLQNEQLPETRWAIPDLVPEGLTLLCGKPKLGKSWLLLSLLMAVSCGGVALGNVAVEQGEVLYISLEDNKKRLQKRANIVSQNRSVSEQFYYATEWPRLDEGGLDYLEEWIVAHPRARLIGIDTWAKIKPRSRHGNSRQYEEDYDAFTPLQELAAKYGVSILVVHHMRKTESEDPLDMVLGSTANTGAVDGFLLLYRKRGETDARLSVTGRDIEEDQDLMLTFTQECATWKIKGESENFARSPEQQAILDVLAVSSRPMTMKEIAATQPNKSYNTVRNLMVKLRNEHKVLLQNNTYTVVRHSQDSQDSHRSQRSQGEVIRAEDACADMSEYENASLITQNSGLTMADYSDEETIVRSDIPEDTPVESLQNGHFKDLTTLTMLTTQITHSQHSQADAIQAKDAKISDAENTDSTQLTMADYDHEETVVSPDISGNEPIEPLQNGHFKDLTTLTTVTTQTVNSQHSQADVIQVKDVCPYRLTITEDAHPLNIEKYQHHRRVITAWGDGWVTHIGPKTLRVVLDGMMSSTEWKFYQALPIKEE